MKISWISRLTDLLFPRCCALCGQRLAVTEEHLCTPCFMDLPVTKHWLAPYDNHLVRLFWGRVKGIEKGGAMFYYHHGSPSSRLVLGIKYLHRDLLGVYLGRMMALRYSQHGFFDDIDAILPVPITLRRRLHRGYNQCEQLARGIREVTGLPVVSSAVRRTSFSKSQTKLSTYERQENTEGVFRLVRPELLAHRHILLVDDVCTTGSTLHALYKAIASVPDLRISILTLSCAHHHYSITPTDNDSDHLTTAAH